MKKTLLAALAASATACLPALSSAADHPMTHSAGASAISTKQFMSSKEMKPGAMHVERMSAGASSQKSNTSKVRASLPTAKTKLQNVKAS